MSNTDSAYFIPLYKYIVQNNIYIPKLNDETEGYNYLDKMEDLQNDKELSIENKYLEYTKGYNKNIYILQIDNDWIFYYIYIICYIDENLDLYNSIIVKLIHYSNLLDEDKKEKIKMIMINCGKTPDVLNGWMEGYIIELMIFMIDLDMEEEFKKITTDLQNSPLESYRGIINYLIGYIGANVDDKIKKYIDILKQKCFEDKTFIIVIKDYESEDDLEVNIKFRKYYDDKWLIYAKDSNEVHYKVSSTYCVYFKDSYDSDNYLNSFDYYLNLAENNHLNVVVDSDCRGQELYLILSNDKDTAVNGLRVEEFNHLQDIADKF